MALPPSLQNLAILLQPLTNILSLGLHPGPTRTFLTLPLATLLLAQSYYKPYTLYWGTEYPMKILAITSAFHYVDWILFASPDMEGWRKVPYGKKSDGNEEKAEGRMEDGTPKGFWGRVWLGVRLATTNRYVGWTQQVKGVRMEVEADYPKWLFVLRKAPRVAFFFLVKDALYAYTASTPHGSYQGYENGKVVVGFSDLPWHRKLFSHGFKSSSPYGVASVALGFANPKDCPSAFGDLKEMYTIRKSWSSVWHQQCRRICSAPGIWLSKDILHLRKGTFASKYLQLFAGFFVSATVHGGASMLCHKTLNDDASFAVFMAQAVVILVEDHAISFGEYMGLKVSTLWKLVGYCWVIIWFGLSMGPSMGSMVANGMWIHEKQADVFGVGPKV